MSRLAARLARLAKVAGAVGVTAAAGGLAGSGAQSRWYVDLDKPPFQPPDVAFPVASSAAIRMPLSREFPVAVSIRTGIPRRNLSITGIFSTPMTPSCGPVMPTSVR